MSRIPLLGGGGIPRRSRDELRNVQMRFQGVRVPIAGVSIPWFGPFINSLSPEQRAVARAVELSTGTHCVRQLSYGYTEPDYTYPIPPGDFTANLSTFRDRLLEDLDAGLIPIVEMAGDGQRYDAGGGTYGFSWFMENYSRIVDGIGEDVLDQCVEFDCWESVSNGGWTPQNLFDASALVRRRRPRAVLAWHFAYAWPGDGRSTIGPIAEWAGPGQDCDVMLGEGDAPFLTKIGGVWVPVAGDALNGYQQRARCWLGPDCNNAMIAPENMEPYYWPGKPDTPRGPRTPVILEIDLYRDVRGRVSLEEIEAEHDYCMALGFRNVC